MSDYTQQEVQRMNSNWVEDAKDGPEGLQKTASVLNESIILKVLREDGLMRRAIHVKPITPMDLDFDPANPEIPTKFEPVEDPAQSYLAMATDWMQPTKDIWYDSKFYRIRFRPIISRMLKMPENQLITARYPVRQYVEGVIKNDILAEEDFEFVMSLERCLAAQALFGTPNIINSTSTKLTLDDVAELAKTLIRSRLGIGCLMVNEVTMQDILKWTQQEYGSYVMKDLVETGLMGEDLRYKSFAGYKWIVTNNLDIIPENTIYAIAPQRMLGRFYQLQSAQSFLKYEYGIFEMYVREIIGFGIANINAVAKLTLNN